MGHYRSEMVFDDDDRDADHRKLMKLRLIAKIKEDMNKRPLEEILAEIVRGEYPRW